MKRNKKLGYALKCRLQSMACYGKRKADFKKATAKLRREKRAELIKQGVPRKEIERRLLHIDSAKNKIFCFETMRSYLRCVDSFASYVSEQTKTSRTSIDDSVKFIQPYIDSMIERGYSPSTINLHLAAVCKATGEYICDYKHPERCYADTKRGVGKAVRDNFNAHRAAESLELNRAVGLRRRELARAEVKDVTFYADHAEIKSIGKGGKHNCTLIYDPKSIAILRKYYEIVKAEGRQRLMTKDQMNHDADLHSARAQCAETEYDRIVADMKLNPERRKYYLNMVQNELKKAGKRCRENMNKPYRIRGKGKLFAEQNGRPIVYDRLAVMYVSLFILHHYRCDTTIQHYLIK